MLAFVIKRTRTRSFVQWHNCRATIVCNLWATGPVVASLKIGELQLEGRVRLLGIRTDIPDILAHSDVVVLSSHWEGLSLSSIEGMASGRPFVASDVDGLREIVKGYGILFPHQDYRALASAIQQLCENPVEYRRVAERCQAKAKQYDISLMAKKYNEVYQDLCPNK